MEEAILKATNFAALRHRNQRRKDSTKTPYINHPIGVAYSIVHEGGIKDVEIIQAALLHDTVEDTATTLEEIEEQFGKNVRSIVAEVTDDKSLPKQKRKMLQVEKAAHKSYGAKIVKYADKLYNLRDLLRDPPDFWDILTIQGYFVWSKKVVTGLRGTHPVFDSLLDDVFKQQFTLHGQSYPAIPPEVDLDEFLLKYYANLKGND